MRFLFLFLIEKGKKKIRQRDQSRARTTSHFQNACGLWVKSDRPKRTDSKRSALHPSANALVQWSHDHVPPEARLTLCSRLRGAQEGRLRLQLDRVLQPGGCSRCFAGAGRRGEGASQDACLIHSVGSAVLGVVTARAYFPLVNVHTGFMHGYTYEPSCRRRWSNPTAVTDFHPMQSLAPKTNRVDQARGRAQGTHLQVCCSVGMDEHPNR